MALVLNIILFLILFALLITTGVFASIGAADTTKSSIPAVNSAFHYLTWSAILSWVAVALVVLAVILYFVYGGETISATGNTVMMVLLGFVLVVTIVVGILCAIATAKLANTGQDAAYRNSLVATIVSLGGVGLLIIILIALWVGHRHANALTHEVNVEAARQTALERLGLSPTASRTASPIALTPLGTQNQEIPTSPTLGLQGGQGGQAVQGLGLQGGQGGQARQGAQRYVRSPLRTNTNNTNNTLNQANIQSIIDQLQQIKNS